MPTETPFLWFDDNAEEAVGFYTSTFRNSRIVSVSRCPVGSPMPAGTAMTVTFEIEGREFMALNGDPHFKFTEAISLLVSCETQEEVDTLRATLTEGGEESQCGWLKDKFGLSWQICPKALLDLVTDPDPVKSSRAMQAMMKMRKIDIATIIAAADAPA